MHVAVLVLLDVEQRTRFAQRLDDLRICVPDLEPAEARQVARIHAVRLHRIQHVVVAHAVAAAGLEVVDAVRRRRVDDTCALLQRHELGEVDRRCAIVTRFLERMPELEMFERRSFSSPNDPACAFVTLEARVHQVFGQHEIDAIALDERVRDIGVHIERLVRRDRPRRGRPDQCVSRAIERRRMPERLGELRQIGIGHPEADIDRKILPVLVFDFRFRESTLTVEAPVDGLQSAVQIALLQEHAERADFLRLVAKGHRRVRMLPVAQDAEALELRLLPRDLLGCIGTAEPQRFFHRQMLAMRLFDLYLDGHTMAIPAGHVGRIEPRHRPALDDEILQYLVERVADVDIGVRIGRAIVQHE